MILLSGGSTPVESKPQWMRNISFFIPARHFVSFSRAIIGGDITAVWPQFPMVSTTGLSFFAYSLTQFRKSIAITKQVFLGLRMAKD